MGKWLGGKTNCALCKQPIRRFKHSVSCPARLNFEPCHFTCVYPPSGPR